MPSILITSPSLNLRFAALGIAIIASSLAPLAAHAQFTTCKQDYGGGRCFTGEVYCGGKCVSKSVNPSGVSASCAISTSFSCDTCGCASAPASCNASTIGASCTSATVTSGGVWADACSASCVCPSTTKLDGTVCKPFLVMSPASAQSGNVSVAGNVTAGGNLTLTDTVANSGKGDILMSSGKAISVNGTGARVLNMGNWGGGWFDLNIFGNANATGDVNATNMLVSQAGWLLLEGNQSVINAGDPVYGTTKKLDVQGYNGEPLDMSVKGNLWLKGDNYGTRSDLRFYNPVTPTNYVGFRAPSGVTGQTLWNLPGTDGTAGQFLKTDGAKNLSWASQSAQGSTFTSGIFGTVTDTSVASATVNQNDLVINDSSATTSGNDNSTGLRIYSSRTNNAGANVSFRGIDSYTRNYNQTSGNTNVVSIGSTADGAYGTGQAIAVLGNAIGSQIASTGGQFNATGSGAGVTDTGVQATASNGGKVIGVDSTANVWTSTTTDATVYKGTLTGTTITAGNAFKIADLMAINGYNGTGTPLMTGVNVELAPAVNGNVSWNGDSSGLTVSNRYYDDNATTATDKYGAVITTAGRMISAGDNTGLYVSNATINGTVNGLTRYGVYIDASQGNFAGSTGAATKNYGLYVNAASTADQNYAAYFGGTVSMTSNPINVTSAWSGSPDATTNVAEISNDTGTYKKLMIVGNKSGGGVRKVGIWDDLTVAGNAEIDNAFIGDVGYGSSYAGFAHKNSATTSGYGFLAHTSGTYALMNIANNGGYMGFRVDNTDKMRIYSNGAIEMNGGQFETDGGGDNVGFHTNEAVDGTYEWVGYYSGGTRQGIMIWDGDWNSCASSSAFCLKAESGNRLVLKADSYVEAKTGNDTYGLIVRDQDSDSWGNLDANDGYLAIGYGNDDGPIRAYSRKVDFTNGGSYPFTYSIDPLVGINSTANGSAYTLALGTNGGTVNIGTRIQISGDSISSFQPYVGAQELRLNPGGGAVSVGRGIFSVDGSAYKPGGGSWANSSSDIRTKKNVHDFADGLAVADALRPVWYTYNGLGGTPEGKTFVGFIAQEVKPIAPYMVKTRMGKLNPDDVKETELLTIDESAMSFINLNAIQELHAQVESQAALIESLEARLEKLEAAAK